MMKTALTYNGREWGKPFDLALQKAYHSIIQENPTAKKITEIILADFVQSIIHVHYQDTTLALHRVSQEVFDPDCSHEKLVEKLKPIVLNLLQSQNVHRIRTIDSQKARDFIRSDHLLRNLKPDEHQKIKNTLFEKYNLNDLTVTCINGEGYVDVSFVSNTPWDDNQEAFSNILKEYTKFMEDEIRVLTEELVGIYDFLNIIVNSIDELQKKKFNFTISLQSMVIDDLQKIQWTDTHKKRLMEMLWAGTDLGIKQKIKGICVACADNLISTARNIRLASNQKSVSLRIVVEITPFPGKSLIHCQGFQCQNSERVPNSPITETTSLITDY